MGKIITVICEKGGTGKSSICFNTAWELAKENKVLIVDLDGQRANVTFFCGVHKTEDMTTMMEVLQGGKDIRSAIVNVKPGLDIVPATISTANISQTAKISRFKKELESIASEYDYIFIDVNPSPNWCHVLALAAAQYCVIVMLPDIASLEAVAGIIESVDEVKDTINPNLKVAGFAFNKYDPRTNLSKAVTEAANEMASHFGSMVFHTPIRSAVVLSECLYERKGITDYAPASKAADDYRSFAEELKGALN